VIVVGSTRDGAVAGAGMRGRDDVVHAAAGQRLRCAVRGEVKADVGARACRRRHDFKVREKIEVCSLEAGRQGLASYRVPDALDLRDSYIVGCTVEGLRLNFAEFIL